MADYTRARALQERFTGKALDVAGPALWLPSGKFLVSHVDRLTGTPSCSSIQRRRTKGPAFDHARLAASLGRGAGKTYSASKLPMTTIAFVNGEGGNLVHRRRQHGVDLRGCRTTAANAPRRRPRAAGAAAAAAVRRRAGGGAGGGRGDGAGAGAPSVSPDGRLTAFIRDHNIYVRPSGAAEEHRRRGDDPRDRRISLHQGGIVWSPDSTKIAAMRIVERGDRRMVRYVESSPADQLQPKTFERFYAKPGDALDSHERCWSTSPRGARRSSTTRSSQLLNCRAPGVVEGQPRLHVRVQRARPSVLPGHRGNAATGAARTLIDEPTDTSFITRARRAS